MTALAWPEVESRRIEVSESGCWVWYGPKNSSGYGQVRIGDKHPVVHRVLYELIVGPIPDGLQCDHLCRTRACVNPAHIELVTRKENILRGESPSAIHARKTHCIRGHEFNEENTYLIRTGGRACKACAKVRNPRKGPATHCKRGHEFSDENTMILRTGSRRCRACQEIRAERAKAKRKAARNALLAEPTP